MIGLLRRLAGRVGCAVLGHRLERAESELLPAGTIVLVWWRCSRCLAVRWTYEGIGERE